jgi:hypothetical protein
VQDKLQHNHGELCTGSFLPNTASSRYNGMARLHADDMDGKVVVKLSLVIN